MPTPAREGARSPSFRTRRQPRRGRPRGPSQPRVSPTGPHQVRVGIDRRATGGMDLEVQMGSPTGGVTAVAHITEHLAGFYAAALAELAHVRAVVRRAVLGGEPKV